MPESPLDDGRLECKVDSLSKIELVLGDITKQKTDAIVNAANSSLLGGGGVDGAIHRVAGPELLRECRGLGGCQTGQAKLTKGYKLSAKFVIHTVGPIWHGGEGGEPGLLRDCYRNSLDLAEKNSVRSIAFPSISTGAYGFPIDRAAGIAISAIRQHLNKSSNIEKVILVCFSKSDYETYEKALAE